MSDAGSGGVSDLFTITARELRTVVRTPVVVAPSVVFGLTVVVVAATGSGTHGSYVPLVLDLVPFVEVLVPFLTVAPYYRAVLSDRESGGPDVLGTFDMSRPAYVGGVYLGRGLALVFVVFESLLAAGATVPVLSPPGPTFLALDETVGSPIAFLRLSVPAVLFTLAITAVAPAVSVTAWTARQAIAPAVGLLVASVVDVDAAAVAGLASGNLGIDAVPLVFAASLNGAFRSLVLGVAVETGRGESSVAALAGLVGWVVVTLAVTALTAWRPAE